MNYATPQDLVNQFGAEEIVQISDRGIPRLVTVEMLKIAIDEGSLAEFTAEEQAATAESLALINSKLLDAESISNGFLASRYSVPLITVPRLVMSSVCDLTRYALYDNNATEAITNRYNDAMKMLKCISKGEINLGVDDSGNKPKSNDGAQIQSGGRVFARGNGSFI